MGLWSGPAGMPQVAQLRQSGFSLFRSGKTTQNISAVEFVRLLRFIRLWKKLGWTIEQTDAAICALYRADLAPLDARRYR